MLKGFFRGKDLKTISLYVCKNVRPNIKKKLKELSKTFLSQKMCFLLWFFMTFGSES
jgi:hypothetical protein